MSGVLGMSRVGFGVQGESAESPGVHGNSTNGAGVRGSSQVGNGVEGITQNFGIGVEGTVVEDGTAIKGTLLSNKGLAGWFAGPVRVDGQLTVSVLNVLGQKHGVVPFPDGSQRLLYCMESPEIWFEDFGSAKLRRGRATVKLNDFANAIVTSDYRVFLSPEGDCNGLYVARKRGAAFEVRELGGGTSSVAFSYRIVGRRKDIKGIRFAKFEMPEAPLAPKMKGSPARRLPVPLMRAPSATERKILARAEKETRAMVRAARKGGRTSVAKRRRK